MNHVVHFEIHAADLGRAQAFYQAVFGWQVKDMGPGMGNYRLVSTDGSEPGRPASRGINGGITPRQGPGPKGGEPVNAFVCIMAVEDIDAHVAKAKNAGGTIAIQKMEVPGVGWLAYAKDPEGNLFGMLQPKMP